MSTQLAQRDTTTALSIHPDQTEFTRDQQAALQQLGVQANSAADVAVFFHQAKRSGLDPFKREIYMITRKGKATIQTGIDGFYKIADRATRASGGTWGIPETLWCGEDGVWRDVWLDRRAPAAAKVTVERDGSRFTTVALTREYSAAGPMWDKMPARMIAKCAEALAIRRAFPDDLSGLYTSEEMAQADNPVSVPSRPAPAPRPTLQDAVQAAKQDTTAVDRITREQWGQITAALTEAGYAGQAQQQAVSDLLGREVTNPQDITAEEATRLLTELSTVPDEDTTEAEVVDEATA